MEIPRTSKRCRRFTHAGLCIAKISRSSTREALVGGYVAASEYRGEFEQTRKSAARLINADAAEIALVDSATTAWFRAFYSVNLSPGGCGADVSC